MNEQYISRLAMMLDPGLWRDPRHTIDTLLRNYKPMMDYHKLSHSILRVGTELTREEKKRAGINPNAKVGRDILAHLTDRGLEDCVSLVTELALAIVVLTEDRISEWSKKGLKKVIFAPAPDCCDICEKLRGEYSIAHAPIPVLDTHLGCRCSYTLSDSCFD